MLNDITHLKLLIVFLIDNISPSVGPVAKFVILASAVILDQEKGFSYDSCSPVFLLHSWKCELEVRESFFKSSELEVFVPKQRPEFVGEH